MNKEEENAVAEEKFGPNEGISKSTHLDGARNIVQKLTKVDVDADANGTNQTNGIKC